MECWWDCITQTTFLHLSIAKGMKWNTSLYHWFVAKVISFIQVTVQVFLHHHVISQFFFPNTDHALWASQICSFSFDFYTFFKSIPQWLIFWNLRISDLYKWNSKGSGGFSVLVEINIRCNILLLMIQRHQLNMLQYCLLPYLLPLFKLCIGPFSLLSQIRN